MKTKNIKSISVKYAVGDTFFPSPYYEQTISKLVVSEDRKFLSISTTDNRIFAVGLTNNFFEL